MKNNNNQERILALDYGSKRIGAAISDPLGITAQPIETIVYKNQPELWTMLDRIHQIYSISLIVLGEPINMDGSANKILSRVELFGEQIKQRYQLQVEFWDERLSSRVAENTIKLFGKSPSRNKSKVDKIAAIWILQGYLDRQNTVLKS